MRLVVTVDRPARSVSWLGPDAVAARMRNLEAARASTVDASAALLRRIERDLHDGTQAQLVALAMRLGEAKEQLEAYSSGELEQVRRLVDEAHRGAKEAIVELRDLARGIHPPALDIGLEGALATPRRRRRRADRGSPSSSGHVGPPRPIEAILLLLCRRGLLANVAQHARPRVPRSPANTQQRRLAALAVRDDETRLARK